MPGQANYNYYIITASNGVSVQCLRGVDPPTMTGGGGRYTIVERPRRKSVTNWTGADPYKMDVPIMLDGWRDNQSIERDCAKLNEMMQSPADFTAPPTMKIDGSVPVKNAKWVIESIDWGTAYVIWHGGVRLRQDAVLHLLQFVDDTVVTVKRQPTANQPYVLKAGETLRGLAAQRGVNLKDVLKLNGLRDPKNVKPGLTILFPPSVFPPIGPSGKAPKVTPKKNPLTNLPKPGFNVGQPPGFGTGKQPSF